MTKARDLSNIPAGGGDFNVDSGTLFVDASADRVGINTSGPAQTLHIKGDDTETGSSAPGITIEQDGTGDASINFLLTGTRRWLLGVDNSDSDSLKIVGANQTDFTDPALTIDTSSHVIVGATSVSTSSNPLEVYGNLGAATFRRANLVGSPARGMLVFRNESLGTVIGSVSCTTNSTSYVTSSDYRLKENVVDMTDAITRVKSLLPKRFNFIADDDDTVVDGFLAHEVSDIVPEAVTGEKDAVEVWQEGEELPDGVSVGDNKLDENDNTIPDYQGIDQAKLVPLLTGALQEAIAKIEALESTQADLIVRIEALEAE